MTSPSLSLQQIIELGQRAVGLDKEGKHEGAAYIYEQTASAIQALISRDRNVPDSLSSKAVEYRQRAAILRNACKFLLTRSGSFLPVLS